MPDGRFAGRGRLAAFVLPLVLLGLVALPVAADTRSSDPSADVSRAQAQLNAARQQAAGADTTLASIQQQLAGAQQHLADVQRQVDRLDAQIAADDATVAQLQARERDDRDTLSTWLRSSYERGLDAPFLYLVASDSFTIMVQRQAQVSRTADAARSLVRRIGAERSQAQAALADVQSRRDALATARQQAATTAALVAVDESRLAQADSAAHAQVAQSQSTLNTAVKRKAAADAAAAAAAARLAQRPKPGGGLTFQPVPGVTFTVDTDLTRPSGESAANLDRFLSGTALAGLGGAFMQAEASHHVSARYLVAHAIEESAFGTSQIAQVKHNLFGFGADDANPFADAVTFPSFAACIDVVSGYVAVNYLSPSGRYYHGPTLRGMNVDYASDPMWAANIARIAVTIP